MRIPLAATVVGTLAVAGLAVAVTGVATAAPSPAPSAAAAAPGAAAPEAAPEAGKHVRKGLHGESVRRAKAGAYVTIGEQRGTLTAASPTSVTLRSADGFERTYAVAGTTKVKVAKADATAADVKSGTKAAVVAVQDGSTWTLRRIAVRG